MSTSSTVRQRTPWLDLSPTIRRANEAARRGLQGLEESAARVNAAVDFVERFVAAVDKGQDRPLPTDKVEEWGVEGLSPIWFDDPSFWELTTALRDYGFPGEADVLQQALSRARNPDTAEIANNGEQPQQQILREIIRLTDQWLESQDAALVTTAGGSARTNNNCSMEAADLARVADRLRRLAGMMEVDEGRVSEPAKQFVQESLAALQSATGAHKHAPPDIRHALEVALLNCARLAQFYTDPWNDPASIDHANMTDEDKQVWRERLAHHNPESPTRGPLPTAEHFRKLADTLAPVASKGKQPADGSAQTEAERDVDDINSVADLVAWIDAKLERLNSADAEGVAWDYWPKVWDDAIAYTYALGLPDAADSVGGRIPHPTYVCDRDVLAKSIHDQLRRRLIGLRVNLTGDKGSPATTEEEQPALETRPNTVHSPDFRSVRWFGAEYSFTENQAACVKMLWEAWEQNAPEVGGKTLLEAADASSDRIDVVFRNSLAWKTLIVPGRTKGSYRLAEPTATTPTRPKTAVKKTSQRARK